MLRNRLVFPLFIAYLFHQVAITSATHNSLPYIGYGFSDAHLNSLEDKPAMWKSEQEESQILHDTH